MGDICQKAKYFHRISKQIASKAYIALLEEVYTTPKPGLVDLYSCGAHTDMDVSTFEKSALALTPYFVSMAELGVSYYGNLEELFIKIREVGVSAEQAMYRATEGVNTHKGVIFSVGIFCAAAGRCIREYGRITPNNLSKIQLLMTKRILLNELQEIMKNKPQSHGELNIKRYDTLGARGEGIRGYPAVWKIALPILAEGRQKKRERNLVKLQALISLMEQVEDSNIISRKGLNTLKEVQKLSKDFLMRGGAYSVNALSELEKMDKQFVDMNISAGGCADLLAVSLFIEKLI